MKLVCLGWGNWHWQLANIVIARVGRENVNKKNEYDLKLRKTNTNEHASCCCFYHYYMYGIISFVLLFVNGLKTLGNASKYICFIYHICIIVYKLHVECLAIHNFLCFFFILHLWTKIETKSNSRRSPDSLTLSQFKMKTWKRYESSQYFIYFYDKKFFYNWFCLFSFFPHCTQTYPYTSSRHLQHFNFHTNNLC